MRSLYLRIYVTVVATLALFALVSGWLLHHHLEADRARIERTLNERVAAWGDLLQHSLPPPSAQRADQAAALRDWSMRLRLPLALLGADGTRIAATESYQRREEDGELATSRQHAEKFADGRTLQVLQRPIGFHGPAGEGPGHHLPPPWWSPGLPDGLGLVALLVMLFGAVAVGSWPVVRRITRRLEALKRGVDAFGAGDLQRRVAEDGQDEVAALGASFNQAASRIEALLRSHQSLLANASHELRSPLARLKMAVSMIEEAPAAERESLRREIFTNIGELDALVEEVLLASRLDSGVGYDRRDPVELLALAAEVAARFEARVEGENLVVQGDERLLRRALRNLLENARRYGGDEVDVRVTRHATQVEIVVSDRGPGVPEAYRERIFEPFFRLPGHAEREGGIGLGLALVRQIAARHGGSVRCDARTDGAGSRFTLALPVPA
ncbi:MAG: HAMP domain-containing histidine kinase [Burkholderiales bacterium]|nr:HAMP domain-containing histidine kinase [Burkholderiales bacterium]